MHYKVVAALSITALITVLLLSQPMNIFLYFFKKVSDKVTGKKVDCVVHFVRLNKTLLKYEDSPDILSMARNSCG